MKKFLSKFVSLITAGAVTLFVSSGSLEALVKETQANAIETAIIYGDVNGDKRIDVFDLVLIKKKMVNPNMEINVIASDVNADGVVDVKDAFEVRDYIHGAITSFSVHRKEAIMEIQNEVNTLNYSIVTSNEPVETSLTGEMCCAKIKL